MGLREDLQDFIVTALWILGGIVLVIAVIVRDSRSDALDRLQADQPAVPRKRR
jgi:hypothetical protein